MDFQALILSFKLAALTTAILLLISIPLARLLTQSKSRAALVLDSLISLPLVLPPTVLGFYFLFLLSPKSRLGGFIEANFDLQLVFSFEGLVLASVIYSLPFMVQPLRSGMASLDRSLLEMASILGKSRFETLWKVILPNIRTSVLSGTVLSFAHTLGEFGVILMIGGSIPGETRVASIAIFEAVESMNYETAHRYSIILIALSFVILLFAYSIDRSRMLKAP